jgi:hypothetical protein
MNGEKKGISQKEKLEGTRKRIKIRKEKGKTKL